MQLLPFNFIALSNGNWLISNSTGAFSYLAKREMLENIINLDMDKIEAPMMEHLIANNFVSPNDEVNLRASILSSGLATQLAGSINSPSLFMIVPTLRCDHDCGYCQVSRVPLDKQGFDADIELIDKILSYISSIKNDQIKIEFQGGEPLLAFDYIKLFYEKACIKLAGIEVSYVICTATGPLHDSIIEWAKDKDIIFSVSLDGPSEVHNFNRPSQYFDAYKTTGESIRKIQSELGQFRVNCLTTISKNSLSYPHEIVDSYIALNFSSLFLRPISPFGFAAKTQRQQGYSVKEFMEFYKKALHYIIEINQKNLFVEEMALIHLRKMFQPLKNSYVDLQSPSGYAFGALVFNYDGKVFGSDEARMLWQSIKLNELVLDDLSSPALLWSENTPSVSILKSSFSCVSSGCEDCAFLPYCGADPMFHLATQGDSMGDKSISFFCGYQKEMFDLLFVLWETDQQARKVFDSWLNQ